MSIFTGLYILPDGWTIGEILAESDGYRDSSFPGCDYRLPRSDYQLATNVKITGQKSHLISCDWFRTRVKIEFVGDGEPSTFVGGWLYSNVPLIVNEKT